MSCPIVPSAVMRILVAAAMCLVLTACKVSLYSDLSEHEANEVLAALSAHGVPASKLRSTDDGWEIRVGQDHLSVALDALRAKGLPRDRYVSLGDVFQKQGLVSSPSEERMRYIHATSQELSHTLRQIDGVIAARVHLVVPATDPLSDEVRPSSAAVFIKHSAEVDLRLLTPTVKDLVANAIEGLTYENVAIALFQARAPAASPIAAGPPAVSLSDRAVISVLAALCLGGLVAVPVLLRRQGINWRTWLLRATTLGRSR